MSPPKRRRRCRRSSSKPHRSRSPARRSRKRASARPAARRRRRHPSKEPATADGPAGGTGTAGVGVYTLGQLDLIGGSTITNEAMYTFNKNTLDQALSIVPGVSVQQSGNSRNERDIQVRGFDRFRVPLYMDGVRMYLPADNRLDFNRFLTADIAEIQVQKGYVSVLNGPGGLGGAINLVSPQADQGGRARGPRRRRVRWRPQVRWASGAATPSPARARRATTRRSAAPSSTRITSTCPMTSRHQPASDCPACQATPTRTAATAITPIPRTGASTPRSASRRTPPTSTASTTPPRRTTRGSPLHVNRQIVQGYFFGATERHWTWHDWSTSTLSWLSKTKLGDASYVKTNAYYNTFGSNLFFHNNRTYTTRFLDSVYDDHSVGGFVEMGTELIPMNTLKGVIHYRRDVHKEWDLDYDPTDCIGLLPADRRPRPAASRRGRSPSRTRSTRRATSISSPASATTRMMSCAPNSLKTATTHDPSLATRDAQRRRLELAGCRHPRLQPDRHRPCERVLAAPASPPCSSATAPASAPVRSIRISTRARHQLRAGCERPHSAT